MRKISIFLTMLFAFVSGFSQNLLTNGDFENGTTGWSGNAANVIDDGSGNHVNEANVAAAGNPWDVNLSNVVALTPGQKYTLKFDAWSDTNRTLIAGIGENHANWMSSTVTTNLTTTKQTFTYDLTATGFGDSNCRVLFDMGAAAGYVGIDNVSLELYVVNPASDATLSSLTVAGTSISGFDPSTLVYNYQLPNGTTTVPTVAATPTQSTSTASVTQATALPGTATVLVTAQDSSTKTYTVNFVLSGPNAPAPTPTVPAANVLSIFSDAYTAATTPNWSPGWSGGIDTVTDTQVSGDNIKKVIQNNDQYFAADFYSSSHLNLTNATMFHMDVWVDALPVGWTFNTKVIDFGGTTSETSNFMLPINGGTSPTFVAGQWNSIDVPIANFTIGSTTPRSDVAQMVFTIANMANVGESVYVDNIYFYNPTTALAVKENSAKNSVLMYPNPANQGETVTISSKVKILEVYNLNGQKIKTSTQNTLNTQGFAKGIYLVKTTDDSGNVSTSKLIIK